MSSAPVTRRRRLWAGALAPLLGAGCFGGQTGGEFEDTDPGLADNPCVETLRELGLDEPTPFGESAAEALELVLGTSASPLLWTADTTPVSVGPERGESSIEISIEYQGGRVGWIDSEPKSAGGTAQGGTTLTALPVCLDRLEVDVIAHIATAGGALDERFPVTLQMSSPERASLVHVLHLAELSGALSVDAPEGNPAQRLFVYSYWDELGFHGDLYGEVPAERSLERTPSSSTAGPMLIHFATWPPPSSP